MGAATALIHGRDSRAKARRSIPDAVAQASLSPSLLQPQPQQQPQPQPPQWLQPQLLPQTQPQTQPQPQLQYEQHQQLEQPVQKEQDTSALPVEKTITQRQQLEQLVQKEQGKDDELGEHGEGAEESGQAEGRHEQHTENDQ